MASSPRNLPPPHLPPGDPFDELTRLLSAQVTRRLEGVEERLEDREETAARVGEVLPQAIARRMARDEELARVLTPLLESTLREAARTSPEIFVDAVYPVLGPVIRKAIQSAFRGMVQSLNQSLDHGLSLRGLRWRWEAWRTGRSFAEVVLLHTLVYRVEHVLLIHRETGLLLLHLHSAEAEEVSGDVVSGMLTALQDFARDSFRVGEEATLERLAVGDLTVWVEQGPLALGALVMRGGPPEEMREELERSLGAVHAEMAETLREFSGDPSPFFRAQPLFEGLLRGERELPSSRPSPLLLVLTALLLGVLVVLGLREWQEGRRWGRFMEALGQTPGLRVTEAIRERGGGTVVGLRDPLSSAPDALATGVGYAPGEVVFRWELFHSHHPQMVEARARTLLHPPQGVHLEVKGEALTARGMAPRTWIEVARREALRVPGILSYQDSSVKDSDALAFQRVKDELLTLRVLFPMGESQEMAGQQETVKNMARGMKELLHLGQVLGVSLRFQLTGHADPVGRERKNRPLSQARAGRVAELLRPHLPKDFPLTAAGVSVDQPLPPLPGRDPGASNRAVSVRIQEGGVTVERVP